MRSLAVAGCVAAVFAGCVGCSGGAAGTKAVPLPGRSLASPGCSTATATSPPLSGVHTAMMGTPGNPFGVAVTKDGRWAFVVVQGELQLSVEVLRIGAAPTPAEVRDIPLPQASTALGVTITSDGRFLLVASDAGAVVLDVARAEEGRTGAVLGKLQAPDQGGAIEVAVSPDGDYAFVSEEDAGVVAVFNLERALTGGFGPADYVGSIPMGVAPVGLAVSPDGQWLYATSEIAPATLRPRAGQGLDETGTLSVIDLHKAETAPASSVIATTDAGCNPVRVVTSPDGSQVWVTARASDDVLCFSAAKLASAKLSRALVAIVRVGEAPVGLIMVRGGSRLVVADSNRFGASGARSDLGIVNVAAALAGKPAFLGHITAGQFPREMALEPDGSVLLVGNFASRQLEAVSVPTLP